MYTRKRTEIIDLKCLHFPEPVHLEKIEPGIKQA